MAVAERDLLFLKTAIKLGEIAKDEARKCLKVLKKKGDSSDAGSLAEEMGLLSPSARLRVQEKVDRRLERKAQKALQTDLGELLRMPQESVDPVPDQVRGRLVARDEE